MKKLFPSVYRAFLPVAIAVGFAMHDANAQLQTHEEINQGVTTPANAHRVDSLFTKTVKDITAQLNHPQTTLSLIEQTPESQGWQTRYYRIVTPEDKKSFDHITAIYHHNALSEVTFATEEKFALPGDTTLNNSILFLRHSDNDDVEGRVTIPDVPRIFSETARYNTVVLKTRSKKIDGSLLYNDRTGLTDINGFLKKPYACETWETVSSLFEAKIPRPSN